MTVTLYIKHDYQTGDFEILTRQELEEEARRLGEEYYCSNNGFDDYLGDRYSTIEIFNFTQVEKAKILKDYRDTCFTEAREEVFSLYTFVEKEI